MKRRLPVAIVVLALVFALFGCSGDDGATGPEGVAGAPGTPQPISVLVAATSGISVESVAQAMVAAGVFPTGTEVNWLTIGVIAQLPTLTAYDAVLLYRGQALTPETGDSLGDALANYVDAGGGLVIGQGMYTDSNLGGRIMTDPYSPLTVGSASGVAGPRTVDVSSLGSPIHPIFNGTDFVNMSLDINNNYSNPALSPEGTLLALDNIGHNLAAVNPANNVIGLNVFPFGEAANTPALQLIANSLLFVGGGI